MQLSVDDGHKTKENYRSTIKKLREENTTLKTQVSDTAKEKPPTVVAKPPAAVSKEKLVEMMEVRVERTQLKEQLQSAQRDIDLLKAQIEGHSLEQQATNAVKREVLLILWKYMYIVHDTAMPFTCMYSACKLMNRDYMYSQYVIL